MNERVKSLIRAYADGVITSNQLEDLERMLLEDVNVREQFLYELNVRAALEDVALGEGGTTETDRSAGVRSSPPVPRSRYGRMVNIARWPLALATVVVALIATIYSLQPTIEPKIATITGLSGPLQWTGNGGRVIYHLSVGTELQGGTIEGMAPESWFELEFNDGSAVTISGNSTLTFSDHGQKELHLKAGTFLGSVVPQAKGKPMLIHTRSARLEVLGTRFGVHAGLASTVLNVSNGKVRVRRRSDGDTVDVLANYRLVVAPNRDMSPVRVPDTVQRWNSQLRRGPHGTYGEWSSGSEEEEAKLKSIPYTTELGATIYTASFQVSTGDRPPVVLGLNSSIRVRGFITSAHKVYFGVTTRQLDGEFAGRFQTIRPANEFQSGQDFEVVLRLRDFHLDPSLKHMKAKLPSVPLELIVDSIWCHTLLDQAGLAITEVELIEFEEQ